MSFTCDKCKKELSVEEVVTHPINCCEAARDISIRQLARDWRHTNTPADPHVDYYANLAFLAGADAQRDFDKPEVEALKGNLTKAIAALEWIKNGKLTEYINSYGRPQPDFPADRKDMMDVAAAVLNEIVVKKS